MKLHYMGKYDFNPNSLPANPHKPNCVPFKEPEDSKKLGKIAGLISTLLLLVLCVPLFFHDFAGAIEAFGISAIFAILALFPHELLHAVCFKKDVYLYTNLKQGMLFVVGPEDMSKAKFIFMSLLPNIVLGLLPYVLFLINPKLTVLGVFGAFNIAAGAGDYLNVFNAATQMPKGSRTYLHHFNSYWYIPEEKTAKH